ncbi:MAG: hypothetical protein ACREXX_06850 [Gammaproteobacteria bacterium]
MAIMLGCLMAAMISEVPPRWEHCSMSMSNTRLSSRALVQAGRRRGRGRLGVLG